MTMSRLLVLQLLADQGSATTAHVAEHFQWSRPRVGMLILRARRDGLVSRTAGGYGLSPRGRDRLMWIQERRSS